MYRSKNVTKGWVVKLIAINCLVFLVQQIAVQLYPLDYITAYFGLTPAIVLKKGYVWQIFTYMFLHSEFFHILFNMYALFVFGIMIEGMWGSRKFLGYYLFCGVGAGISIFVINYALGNMGSYIPTIGASGAVFGLLLAFGILYPEIEVLLFFFIPMKARTMVIVFGGFELFMELSGGMANISHVGHLGGLLFGIIYFLIFEKGRSLKWKFKKWNATHDRPFMHSDVPIVKGISDPTNEMKKNIIAKLKNGEGLDSLSEDEYQFVKYLDIMTEKSKTENKSSIDIKDDHITDRTFIDIVRQYGNL